MVKHDKSNFQGLQRHQRSISNTIKKLQPNKNIDQSPVLVFFETETFQK